MEFILKFTALVIFTNVFGVAAAKKSNKLFDEDVPVSPKAAECVFDKQRYELGSLWTPDLGPPIGILSCMRCKCVPFQKKRRIVARVHCHSIKEQCPKPKCEEPIMLPGRCCKICPGDLSPETAQDILPQNIVEIEQNTNKHFVSLLTSLKANSLNETSLVATGRFSFKENSLYYSFYTSEKAGRPQKLQFIDTQGNILEEFSIFNSTNNPSYQDAPQKICGVWRRLPKGYQKMLRQEKIYAVLVWKTKGQELTISGSVKKNNALESELLSSLLKPEPTSNSIGAAGTAMVSLITNSTVKISVIFNGLFMPSEIANVPIKITLSLKKHLVFEETINILKPASDLNTIEFNVKMSEDNFTRLTKGEMILNIASVSNPQQLKLSGNIMTRATCEMFQATLASSEPGMSWLYLNNAGSLIYNVYIGNSSQPNASLVHANSKTMTEDTSLTLKVQENGWANGTMDKVTPEVLQSLYAGDLSINVATSSQKNIEGRLNVKYMDEARDSAAPVLLKEQSSLAMNSLGMAWVSVDSDCYLHYDVSLEGLKSDRKLELWMELYPIIAPGAPFINKPLESFQGTSIEGSPVEVLTRDELSMLENGVNYLKVKDAGSEVVLLMATVVKVPIPASCTPYNSLDKTVFLDDLPEVVQSDKCFFEGKFHKNEEIWVPANNSCQMCFCQNGKARCDLTTCPELSCTFGRKTIVEGECCPVCTNDSMIVSSAKGPKCVLNGKSYLSGSKFHPFLLPIGFDLCTECYCDHQQYQIKCIRLTNTEKCGNRKNVDINDPFSDDFMEKVRNPQITQKENPAVKVLSEGGCKNPINANKPYINGSKYHPFIDSLGEYKCVTCKCQDGNAQCSRQHCDKSTCKQMYEIKRKKGKVNASEFCCSLKDCRKMRYKKKAN
ncbi:unnamed protein product [Ceutorhynchus assimilis]|uniref:VWFC domain-containing protein n=1 Tax=Ceutorhynchus assimilis TaxID=467358 RepID=A0A9N9QMW4_9CUCU|nr:unnamed protein product [Ceutorhynchus assimilis]